VLFNSCTFVTFLVAVTIAHFLVPPRARWALMLGASCIFYMFFVPVYILILLVTIGIDYLAGIWIEDSRDPRTKRLLVVVSASSVCITLFIFKYFNFFNTNIGALAAALHWNYPIKALRIVLPIGLSFHTFQSLSYVIEVYRGRQKAERHLGIYALYVMYFPQLVAGPIERPQHLLHQFHEPKPFSSSRLWDGLSLALWGLFKKVAVADALAIYVDATYPSSEYQSGATLLLATYFFALQIYCDFSGYSDIARGVSRIYGIELMKNFDTPYFSTTISEFWSRWHISLSTWFRDYVYIPLGGNRVSTRRNLLNLFIVFVLSGFWHGANWTFIVWGTLHAIYLIGERLFGRGPANPRGARSTPSRESFLRGVLTFHLVLVGWIFFRAADVTTAFHILRRVLWPRGPVFWDPVLIQGILGISVVVGVDLITGPSNYWDDVRRSPVALRFAYTLALLFGIMLFGIEQGAQFIYFQF
jgi:D-alanyl-lipoteichoic acid acyltransferase DltB (MBOAT superfamily)